MPEPGPFFFDGQLIKPGHAPSYPLINRGLLFGDGLFETMRSFAGKLPFFDQHWQRLQKGMEFLDLVLPEQFDGPALRKLCSSILAQTPNARLRLTVFRAGQGAYTPPGQSAHFILQWQPLQHTFWPPPEKGLELGLFTRLTTPAFPLSQHKTLSALPYVLASQEKQKRGWDEVLLFNTRQQPVEASSSNIFVCQNGQWATPPLQSGCLAGTTRALLLETMKKLQWPIVEKALELDDLYKAEHLWLTNSIQGIRWVKKLHPSPKNFTPGPLEIARNQIEKTYLGHYGKST